VGSQDLTRQVIELLSGWAGPKKAIGPGTSVNRVVDGDDAGEFLEEIFLRFGTSFEGLHFRSYFVDEPEAIFRHWALKLGFKDKMQPLPVRHLVEVIERGSWFDPPAPP
jgi:hypothetical protein